MKEHTMRRPDDTLSPITLRIADACRVTGLGRSKFYELIKAGEIEVIKVGTISLVPMSGIEALLERSRSGTVESAKRGLEGDEASVSGERHSGRQHGGNVGVSSPRPI
jgi:excisionase family DNA binding protein